MVLLKILLNNNLVLMYSNQLKLPFATFLFFSFFFKKSLEMRKARIQNIGKQLLKLLFFYYVKDK
jgi:hypothetical protein